MALNIKNKIWLGTFFLFVLLLLTGGVGIYYLMQVQNNSRNILRDNYETLSYAHAMQQQLLSAHTSYEASVKSFETLLKRQQDNITEKGEKEATDSLTFYFNRFKQGDTLQDNVRKMEGFLQQILALNMKAMRLKNDRAKLNADNALTIILIISSLVFLISFTFLLNFPSVITNPVNQLTAAIKAISEKKYDQRIYIQNKDEFGNLANAFNEMAEKLEYFESSNVNKLMFEKSRAEAVINSLQDASIGIDNKDRILFANKQALQLLGLRSEEIVGKNVNDISRRNELFRYLLEDENSTTFKAVIDNRENFFTKEVLEVGEGETKNKVLVLKNITSYKELDVAKTNFIATVSHELKTPLASSDFSLKLLLDERTGPLSASQKELIENLKDDNNRMLKILSELLNMAQVESGRIQLNVQQINPVEIVKNAIHAVSVKAKEKEIILEEKVPSQLPMIKADADKTTWVLNNFLTNAIKYSSAKSNVTISVRLQDKEIIFSVADHGPGIDHEYLPRLFERYFQVPGSKEKGTGLGLAISKEFIEAQHGRIFVESEIGTGSVFSFALSV